MRISYERWRAGSLRCRPKANLIGRLLLGAGVCAALAACAGVVSAQEPPRFDGRDHYTLFDRHLQTRELRRQLEQPGQEFRLLRNHDRLWAAGEFSFGTQQTWDGGGSLWQDDDLIESELSLFSRRLRFMFVQWQTDYSLLDLQRIAEFMPPKLEGAVARYADVTLDLPLPAGFHSALEYALRFRA